MKLTKNLISVQDKLNMCLIILLLATAVFFRFYAIRDYAVLLGDEGRDMIIMRNIFVKHDLPFLGPTASVGGFYLGPIYYWMAAPFLLLSGFDPAGPSYMVAILGVFTVLILFKFLKDEIGFWPSVLSSFLYATAPLVVRYSRSSWNPNPMPFFSLLLIYFIYKAIKKQNYVYYFGVGACFGIVIQLHYLSLILAPMGLLIIIFNERFKRILLSIILITIGSLVTFSPFLFFEIKNDFPNFKTILEFATRGSTIGYSGNILQSVAGTANLFLTWITKIEYSLYTQLYFWISSSIVLASLIYKWKSSQKLVLSIGLIYFLGGVFFLKLYAGQLHDYYFGIIFPAPFIIFGLLTHVLWNKLITRIAVISFFAITLALFVTKGFYTSLPNRLIEQTNIIADAVIKSAGGKQFNFALVSQSNSDHAYRYYLEIKGHPPTSLEENVTDQLIVLCEQKECEPLGHPLWEIAGFGRAEIVEVHSLADYGFKIYTLIHHESSKNMVGKPAIKGI